MSCPVIGTKTVATIIKKKYLKRLLLYLSDLFSNPKNIEILSTRVGMNMKLKKTLALGSIEL